MDSDGDGFSNGWELGDPCCTWSVGANPLRTTDISHPGFADRSFPSPSLYAHAPSNLELAPLAAFPPPRAACRAAQAPGRQPRGSPASRSHRAPLSGRASPFQPAQLASQLDAAPQIVLNADFARWSAPAGPAPSRRLLRRGDRPGEAEDDGSGDRAAAPAAPAASPPPQRLQAEASSAEQAFRRGVAAAAGARHRSAPRARRLTPPRQVDPARIEIINVMPGSIVIEGAGEGAGRSVEEAVASLQGALEAQTLDVGLPVDYSRSGLLSPGTGAGDSELANPYPSFPYNYVALGIFTGAALLAGLAVAAAPTRTPFSALLRQAKAPCLPSPARPAPL
eukprot:tig00001532_g9270.t1